METMALSVEAVDVQRTKSNSYGLTLGHILMLMVILSIATGIGVGYSLGTWYGIVLGAIGLAFCALCGGGMVWARYVLDHNQ